MKGILEFGFGISDAARQGCRALPRFRFESFNADGLIEADLPKVNISFFEFGGRKGRPKIFLSKIIF